MIMDFEIQPPFTPDSEETQQLTKAKMDELKVVIGELVELMANGRPMPENLSICLSGRKDSNGISIKGFGFEDADINIDGIAKEAQPVFHQFISLSMEERMTCLSVMINNIYQCKTLLEPDLVTDITSPKVTVTMIPNDGVIANIESFTISES